MNTDVMEVLIKAEPSKKQEIGKFLSIWANILLLFFGVFIFLFFDGTIGFIMEMVGVAFFFINRFVIFPSMKIEYEYLYCDKTVSVDVIYAQKKRKKLGEYALERMELLCPMHSERLDAYKNREFKVKDYWSRIPYSPKSLKPGVMAKKRTTIPYVMLMDGKEKIILDLPEDFVKMIHNNAPRKVYFD